jgi:hypothetical protein
MVVIILVSQLPTLPQLFLATVAITHNLQYLHSKRDVVGVEPDVSLVYLGCYFPTTLGTSLSSFDGLCSAGNWQYFGSTNCPVEKLPAANSSSNLVAYLALIALVLYFFL